MSRPERDSRGVGWVFIAALLIIAAVMAWEGWTTRQSKRRTVSHAIKGNVDILIALIMHLGAAVGAQIGTLLTQYVTGVNIRLAFVPLPLLGAAIILHGLLTGQGAH